jgi:hypothetical protein
LQASAFHKPALISNELEDSANSASAWPLVLAGFFAATASAFLLAQLPRSHKFSWIELFFRAAAYVSLTAASGTAAISLTWNFLGRKPSHNPPSWIGATSAGWAFLPCIALLYAQRSAWIFLIVTFATFAAAFRLRKLFPEAEDKPDHSNPQPTQLPSLYGLPTSDFHPLRALSIAICAQGALILAIAGYLLLASILLATCLFLLVWRGSVSNSTAGNTSKQSQTLLYALATLITALVLLPPVRAGFRGSIGRNNAQRKPPPASTPADAQRPASDYVGIILWPPPAKRAEILPPAPRDFSVHTGSISKPLVIPFDGPYWYFKIPGKGPGRSAHIAHGQPTDVNIRSSNWEPLLMEAHQNLGTSIDLGCCGEIDVAITNVDIHPGAIALGLLLTDSSSPGKQSVYLGERTIESSQAVPIPWNRPPVKEVLHFSIPPSATVHKFDSLTVIFLPTPYHAQSGAKVSIQNFVLIPK